MTAIADAADGLTRCLPEIAVLTAHPGTAPSGPGGKPGSRPPWNPQAANALWDAIAAIADWEAELRYRVTGASGRRRPVSATGASLKAIVSLSHAVPRDLAMAAARDFTRCTRAIRQHPDIDEEERPQKVQLACPYCGMPMMRLFPRAATVVCLRGGFACWDSDGNPPLGRAEIGRLGPCVVWADGLVS
jgi:hypothetical protein